MLCGTTPALGSISRSRAGDLAQLVGIAAIAALGAGVGLAVRMARGAAGGVRSANFAFSASGGAGCADVTSKGGVICVPLRLAEFSRIAGVGVAGSLTLTSLVDRASEGGTRSSGVAVGVGHALGSASSVVANGVRKATSVAVGATNRAPGLTNGLRNDTVSLFVALCASRADISRGTVSSIASDVLIGTDLAGGTGVGTHGGWPSRGGASETHTTSTLSWAANSRIGIAVRSRARVARAHPACVVPFHNACS